MYFLYFLLKQRCKTLVFVGNIILQSTFDFVYIVISMSSAKYSKSVYSDASLQIESCIFLLGKRVYCRGLSKIWEFSLAGITLVNTTLERENYTSHVTAFTL